MWLLYLLLFFLYRCYPFCRREKIFKKNFPVYLNFKLVSEITCLLTLHYSVFFYVGAQCNEHITISTLFFSVALNSFFLLFVLLFYRVVIQFDTWLIEFSISTKWRKSKSSKFIRVKQFEKISNDRRRALRKFARKFYWCDMIMWYGNWSGGGGGVVVATAAVGVDLLIASLIVLFICLFVCRSVLFHEVHSKWHTQNSSRKRDGTAVRSINGF